jgi:hypothetical protein
VPARSKESFVAAASWIKYCYLAYFTQPKTDRELYRLVKTRRVCRIMEIGISDVCRAARLVEVAQRYATEQKVSYTGLDWFDARAAELAPLSIKQAHCTLQATGAQVRLVPGAPGHSLAAVANAHQNTGLILISAAVSDADLKSAWFYLPRMLRNESVVLREQLGNDSQWEFLKLSASELAEQAARNAPRRAA